MPRFNLAMTCDNDAFAEDLTGEIARILRETAARVERDGMADADFYQTIRDANGNDIGRFRLAINRRD